MNDISIEEYREAQNIIKMFESQNIIGLNDILERVCKNENVTIKEIKSKKRQRKLVVARQLFCYLASKQNSDIHRYYTFAEIGKYINRHHASVIYAIRIVNEVREVNNKLKYYE